jgi:RNA polymerase sigma-70 factor (ECF subfamily)
VANVAELAGRLTAKDESALAQAYDLYGGAVYQLALRITRDPGVAEEICLDSFMQLWQQAETLDRRNDNLLAWLFTIARSRAIDRLRMTTAVKRTPVDAVAPAAIERPDEKAEHAQRRDLVRKALAALTPPQRAAVELAYYEGLSHTEIAQRLGEPLGTVKTRIRQAMIAMRLSLSPLLSETP